MYFTSRPITFHINTEYSNFKFELLRLPNCICDRIVCRIGKAFGGNSSGDVVVTIDGMSVVWKRKFTYQVIYNCVNRQCK